MGIHSSAACQATLSLYRIPTYSTLELISQDKKISKNLAVKRRKYQKICTIYLPTRHSIIEFISQDPKEDTKAQDHGKTVVISATTHQSSAFL